MTAGELVRLFLEGKPLPPAPGPLAGAWPGPRDKGGRPVLAVPHLHAMLTAAARCGRRARPALAGLVQVLETHEHDVPVADWARLVARANLDGDLPAAIQPADSAGPWDAHLDRLAGRAALGVPLFDGTPSPPPSRPVCRRGDYQRSEVLRAAVREGWTAEDLAGRLGLCVQYAAALLRRQVDESALRLVRHVHLPAAESA